MIDAIKGVVAIGLLIFKLIFVILLIAILPYAMLEATKDNPENFIKWTYKNVLKFICTHA
mgnify:FL=1